MVRCLQESQEVGASLSAACGAAAKQGADGIIVITYALYLTGLTIFSRVLRHLPLSVAYTTWCALGTVGVSVGSCLLYEERISPARWVLVALTVPCVVGLYVVP